MGYGDRRGGFGGGRSGGGGYGGGGGSFQRDSEAPVKVGEEIDVKIESVGEKGDGIAKKNGFVIFVPGTKAGDEVKIRITRVLRKVGFAEVVGKSEGGSSDRPPRRSSEESGEGSSEQPEGGSSEQYEDTENFGEDNQEN